MNIVFCFLMSICLLFVLFTGPFDYPDAYAHFSKSVSISYGALLPQVKNGVSGGDIPNSINKFENMFTASIGTPGFIGSDKGPTKSEMAAASKLEWGKTRTFTGFASSSEYPPFLYVPAAVGLLLSRIIHQNVLASYYSSEIFSLLFCLLIIWYSLKRLPKRFLPVVAIFLFTPEVDSLLASGNPDGVLIALAILFASEFSRIVDDTYTENVISDLRQKHFKINKNFLRVSVVVPLLLIIIQKPVYIFFVFLVPIYLLLDRKYLAYIKESMYLFLLPLALSFGWNRFSSNAAQVDKFYNPSKQFRNLVDHPFRFPVVIFNTLFHNGLTYWKYAIGCFGWLTISLHSWFYILWTVFIIVSIIIFLKRIKYNSFSELISFTVLVLSMFFILLGLYGISPFNLSFVGGVQGRYFLPLIVPVLCGVGVLSKPNDLIDHNNKIIIFYYLSGAVSFFGVLLTLR